MHSQGKFHGITHNLVTLSITRSTGGAKCTLSEQTRMLVSEQTTLLKKQHKLILTYISLQLINKDCVSSSGLHPIIHTV